MDLRDIIPLDLFQCYELISVYLYALREARARASVTLHNGSLIQLKPYEVLVKLENAQRDLNMSEEQIKNHFQTLQGLKRIRVREYPKYILILYNDICFPINGAGDSEKPGQETRSIFFERWVEEEKLVIEKRFSKKYLELVTLAYQHLAPVARGKELFQITMDDHEEFVESLRSRGLKNSSINDYSRAIHAGFNRALKRGYLTSNPWAGYERLPVQRKQPIIFQRQEVDLLLNNSPDWMVPMIKFTLLTAMRRNEVLNQLWENLDLEEEFFWVRHTKSFRPKMGKERLLAVTVEIRTLLKQVKQRQLEMGIESDYVFVDDKGKNIESSRFTHEIKKTIRFAGLREDLHLHALRRTAATHLYFKTKDIYTVKEVLGHSDFRVTMLYLGVPEEKIKDAMNQMTIDDFLTKVEM